MPSAVIDTSVTVAACYGRRAWQSPLLTAWQEGRFDWVTSEALLAEFRSVTVRPEHQLRIRAGVADGLEKLLRQRATLVTPLDLSECPPCRDPNDEMVILTALTTPADFLVSADKDLLDDVALKAALLLRGVRIVASFQFLAALG